MESFYTDSLKLFSNNKGELDIILGPMYSGKTSELLSRLLRASELGIKILYINHTFDTRNDGGFFSTHHPFLGHNKNCGIDFISLESLRGIRKENYDLIGIDEAQFFDDYLLEFCKVHVDQYKKHVIVSGLDADSNRQKFGHILDLIPYCDSVVKLKAYCPECGYKKTDAIFTYKYCGNENQRTEVGGKDKYKALCRNCYLCQSN